jgi:hypothetical protein
MRNFTHMRLMGSGGSDVLAVIVPTFNSTFAAHVETTEKTTQVRPRNTISHRLKAIIVSSGRKCGMGRV